MIKHNGHDDLLGSLPSRRNSASCPDGEADGNHRHRKKMHLADGARIRELRRTAVLNQKQLATLAGLSPRTVRTMENSEDYTKLCSIRRVAWALGVGVDQILGLSKESLLPLHRWEDIQVPVRDLVLVRQALAHDMRGEFDRAVELLDQGLSRLDAEGHELFRDLAFLSIKKFSILSNAGRHQEGLRGLESMARHAGWRRRQSSDLWGLLRYHRAVILRRLGFYTEAAAEFGELLGSKKQAAGAHHQLGVLCLIQGAEDLDMTLLELAKMHLEMSRRSWEESGGGYRTGFSERRLAQLALQLGEPDTAEALFELACQRFADDECERYLLATREDIEKLARNRGVSAG
jgi:transcriptional regulator with XRE-family HTH domain